MAKSGPRSQGHLEQVDVDALCRHSCPTSRRSGEGQEASCQSTSEKAAAPLAGLRRHCVFSPNRLRKPSVRVDFPVEIHVLLGMLHANEHLQLSGARSLFSDLRVFRRGSRLTDHWHGEILTYKVGLKGQVKTISTAV